MTLVAYLVILHLRLDLYLGYFAVSVCETWYITWNCTSKADMTGKGNYTSTLGVIEFWITGYSSIEDIAVAWVKKLCQFTCFHSTWNSTYENSSAWSNFLRLGCIHDVITVGQFPYGRICTLLVWLVLETYKYNFPSSRRQFVVINLCTHSSSLKVKKAKPLRVKLQPLERGACKTRNTE